MEIVTFFMGLVVGSVATFVTCLLWGKAAMASESQSDTKPVVAFTPDGYAYWQSEDGLHKAAVLRNGVPDFENSVVLNMMEVPAEELPMLLEIIAHIK